MRRPVASQPAEGRKGSRRSAGCCRSQMAKRGFRLIPVNWNRGFAGMRVARGGKFALKVAPRSERHPWTRDKTRFKCRRYRRAIHAGSDEDELLPTVAERRAPVRVDSGDGLASGRPVLLWGRRPPAAEGPGVGQTAGDAVLEDEVGVGLDPEPALGAEDARHGAGEDGVDPAGVEWQAGAPDERFDAVFLGFGDVILGSRSAPGPRAGGCGPSRSRRGRCRRRWSAGRRRSRSR